MSNEEIDEVLEKIDAETCEWLARRFERMNFNFQQIDDRRRDNNANHDFADSKLTTVEVIEKNKLKRSKGYAMQKLFNIKVK